MSSLKMTFSLTSLFLIFAMAFVAMPVMAATGGPTPTITLYSGPDNPNAAAHATNNPPHKHERADVKLLVTFDVRVETDLAADDFTVRVAEAIGEVAEDTTTSGIGTIVPITRGANAGKSFMVPVDLTTTASTNHVADTYSFGYISFVVNADVVLGTQAGDTTDTVGNVRSAALELTPPRLPKANAWTLTPELDASSVKDLADGTAEDDFDDDDKILSTASFTVNIVASNGPAGETYPIPNAGQIQVKDSNGDAVSSATAAVGTAYVANKLPVTITFSALTDAPIFVGINPNWAGTAGTPVRIPAEQDDDDGMDDEKTPPSVDISLVSGTLDTDMKTFDVKFTFTKAATNGADVPTEFTAGDIKVTTDAAGETNAAVSVDDVRDLLDGVSWVAEINYSTADLPLYVTTTVDVEPDAVAEMVEAPNNAPVFATVTTTRSVVENTAASMNIGDPVTAMDADSDTLTYSLSGTDAASFGIVATSGQLQTSAALDYETKTTYMVTVTADDGSDTDTIEVTINVTNDTADDPVDQMDPAIARSTNVMAMPQNDGSIEVTWAWEGSSTAETDALADFVVLWDPDSEGNVASTVVDADQRIYTLPAAVLTAGESTTVYVGPRAHNGSGYSTPDTTAADPVTPINPNALRFAPGTTISDMTFTAGTVIGTTAMPYVQLPQAHGGTGVYTYSLLKGIGKVDITDTGDNGLSVDKVNLRLQGRPAAEAASTLYTWRVTDAQAHGDIEDAVELEFNITVDAAAIITPTNVAPVVTITTEAPDVATSPFVIRYTVEDANADDTVTDSVTHLIRPATATGYRVTPDLVANTVTITQAAGAPIAVITVTVTADDGTDTHSDGITVTFAAKGTPVDTDDTTPPTVVSTLVPINETDLRLTCDFSEEMNIDSLRIGRATTPSPGLGPTSVLTVGEWAQDTRDPTIYRITVRVVGGHWASEARAGGADVLLERRAMDLAGNSIVDASGVKRDLVFTYTPVRPAPTIVANPGTISCRDGSAISVTFSKTIADALVDGDITLHNPVAGKLNGWTKVLGSFAFNANTDMGTLNVARKSEDRSWLGQTQLQVMVQADAVKDMYGNTNTAQSATFTIGPVLEIPGNSYIVVVRKSAMTNTPPTHLSRVASLYLQDPNVRAPHVNVKDWDCMPDLTVLFGKDSPGIGGGGLIVLPSPDHAGGAIATGSVGISEIMWATDAGVPYGRSTNLEHAQEQWIELHNLNSVAVKVTLFDLEGNEAYHDINYGEIDRMGNFNIGGSWEAKGQSGNSEYGKDFISMYRSNGDEVPTSGKNYSHGHFNGRDAGKWTASTYSYLTRRAGLAHTGQLPVDDLNYDFRGTPGRSNILKPGGPVVKTPVPRSPVIFNEIANRSDGELEWIELRNVTDAEVNLRNYRISILTDKGKDENFYLFPVNDNTKIPAKGLLLLVATDPRHNDAHPVAVGHNILAGDDQVLGLGQLNADPKPHLVRYRVTPFAVEMPDDGEFILILRKPDNLEDKNEAGKGPAELASDDDNPGNDDLDKIVDLAGHVGGDKLKDQGPPIYTDLWPLKVFGASFSHGKLEVNRVHFRRDAGRDGVHGEKNEGGKTSFHDTGYTGIGYKRHAKAIPAHGGNPGHPNDTLKNLATDIAATGTVIISEIMYSQTDVGYPQWIELYNTSKTQSVNLKSEAGWRLVIENHDNGTDPVDFLSGTLNFKSSGVQTILPQQTVMIVSTPARRSGSAYFDTSVIFPETRVFAVWSKARGELGMSRSTDPILSETGFYLKLIDGKNNVSDEAGNLDASRRRRNDVEWVLPMVEEERASIIRRVNRGRESDGLMPEGWLNAAMPNYPFKDVPQTWYGHPEDRGTPGITGGRVLPVSLSKFRPERLDTGEIVVRWITESELNNAGFNILRSDTRSGEYTKVNTSLIAGKGTTSERHTYEWKDTTAKPNVVYYYQIQDVSIDGKVQTLRMSRLKGHVSAAGKVTTTWGELKALQ